MTEALTCQFDFNPDEFGDREDAMFHLGESYPFAHGEIDGHKWECRLANCGEQHLISHEEDGELVDDDVLDKYNTDKKLWEAIDNNIITIINNSWWELEFFKVDDDSSWYLDLFGDNSDVVDNPAHALAYFIRLSQDKNFVKDLKLALVGG